MPVFLAFAVGTVLFCLCSLVVLFMLPPPAREVERLQALVTSQREDRRVVRLRERLVRRVLSLTQTVRKLLGNTENSQTRRQLDEAGFRGEHAGDTYFAAQFLTILTLLTMGSFSPVNTMFCVLIGGILGYLVPGMWLVRRGSARRERIRRSIPDAVDLLVICVDAGLGLDQALLRVSEELDVSHPEMNAEFQRVNLQQRAGIPRIEAWQSLAARTRLEEFTSFSSMLSQTERFGTPIVKALATYSHELRQKRRQRAEEAAAKTKIKIIFPLVLFIFPCIFIVLLAPALLSIADGMKTMAK